MCFSFWNFRRALLTLFIRSSALESHQGTIAVVVCFRGIAVLQAFLSAFVILLTVVASACLFFAFSFGTRSHSAPRVSVKSPQSALRVLYRLIGAFSVFLSAESLSVISNVIALGSLVDHPSLTFQLFSHPVRSGVVSVMSGRPSPLRVTVVRSSPNTYSRLRSYCEMKFSTSSPLRSVI